MNGIGVGDFTSVKLDTFAAAQTERGKGGVERSTAPSVQDAMRDLPTSDPYGPNNDSTEILNSIIPDSTHVPIFPPIDMITFDDTDNETVEASVKEPQTAPMEGNFGESAAVAPQDVSSGAEVRPDGGLSIDIEGFVNETPEGLGLTCSEVIDTLEHHLAGDDITDDMRSALEFTRDGFERAMEALQGEAGNDFGANERAIDAMEKAMEAAMAARENAIDSHELDLVGEIHELAENLKTNMPEESSKAILGVMMGIFALLNLRDGPELRGPTWQGGLAHAVLEPSTPAYAKKKATRILNMAQRYKEIMKQQARMESQGSKPEQPKEGPQSQAPKEDRPPQSPGQKERVASDGTRTASSTGKGAEIPADGHRRVRGSPNSSDSAGGPDGV